MTWKSRSVVSVVSVVRIVGFVGIVGAVGILGTVIAALFSKDLKESIFDRTLCRWLATSCRRMLFPRT